MENGLRKRATGSFVKQASLEGPKTDGTVRNDGGSTRNLVSNDRWTRAGTLLLVIIHIVGTLIFVAGFVWRTTLHTGTECEMTYSFRNFLEIDTTLFKRPSRASDAYKLYKFVDGRDPRYQRLLRENQPLQGNAHCGGANATIVLYIPGHWGSYTQARSVGAHGTQWTASHENTRDGQLRMIDGTWHGKAHSLENFIYEVYAVDFADQGGALHGRFLELQSDFVAQAVGMLSKTCSVDAILVVAHSMGGYVARLTPIRHPDTRRLMPNILTLATPHGNPLYAFDETIHKLHKSLLNNQHDASSTLLVSISGGVRDEMIAPKACEVSPDIDHTSHSYLTTNLMSNGRLGMDHRAIVWCHGVLEQVRKVIWNLSTADSNEDLEKRSAKVVHALGNMSYHDASDKMAATLNEKYGTFKSLAMESAMLYNLPLLYGLYATVAGLHWALVGARIVDSPIYRLIMAIGMGWVWSDASKFAILILALVAHSLLQVVMYGLDLLSPGTAAATNRRLVWIISFLVTLGVGTLGLLLTFRASLATAAVSLMDLLGCILFVAGIVSLYMACFWLVGGGDCAITQQYRSASKDIAFVALVMLTAPGILAGTLLLMKWEQRVEARSWIIWASLVLPVLVVCLLKKTTTMIRPVGLDEKTVGWKLVAIRLLSVLWACPDLVTRGNAFRASYMVVGVAWTELLIDLPIQRKTQD